jgi:hypothetical protein
VENVGIFYGPWEYFTPIWYMVWSFGTFYGNWVYFSRFGMSEKPGNPAQRGLSFVWKLKYRSRQFEMTENYNFFPLKLEEIIKSKNETALSRNARTFSSFVGDFLWFWHDKNKIIFFLKLFQNQSN